MSREMTVAGTQLLGSCHDENDVDVPPQLLSLTTGTSTNFLWLQQRQTDCNSASGRHKPANDTA